MKYPSKCSWRKRDYIERLSSAWFIFSCRIRTKWLCSFWEYTDSPILPKKYVGVSTRIYIVNRVGFDLPLPLNTITIVGRFPSSGDNRWLACACHCGLNCCTHSCCQIALGPLQKMSYWIKNVSKENHVPDTGSCHPSHFANQLFYGKINSYLYMVHKEG